MNQTAGLLRYPAIIALYFPDTPNLTAHLHGMPAVGGGGNVLKQCFVSDGGDAPVIRISLFEILNLYVLPVDCVVEHLCRFSAKGLKRFRTLGYVLRCL